MPHLSPDNNNLWMGHNIHFCATVEVIKIHIPTVHRLEWTAVCETEGPNWLDFMDEKRNNVSSTCKPFFSIHQTVFSMLDKTNNSGKINILSLIACTRFAVA